MGKSHAPSAGPSAAKGRLASITSDDEAGAHADRERVGELGERVDPFRLDGAGFVQRGDARRRDLPRVVDQRLGHILRRRVGHRDAEEAQQRRLIRRPAR